MRITGVEGQEKKLRCILYFERSRNQRQGPEVFLGKWNS